MIYLGGNRVSRIAQVRWTVTLFLAPWRCQDARCLEGSKRIPAMKSPLFLCIFLVALSLCASSPFFAYARSAAPAVSSPSDAQGAPEVVPPRSSSDVVIPGPLRSFLRMAGISPKVSPEEVLPLLARNVFAQGYQGWQGSGGRTEFLILLIRYVQQARELKALAGSEGIIHVSNCEEADSLLRILGYRLRQDCGASGSFLV